MNLPTPSVEYGLLSPMLIVLGVAVVGVLVEAFLPRQQRYAAQLVLSLGGLAASFVAVVGLARDLRGGTCKHRHAIQIYGDHSVVEKALQIVEPDLKSGTQKILTAARIERYPAVPRCSAEHSFDSHHRRFEFIR